MERELTVKRVSEILGTNPETVRRWLRAGVLTAYPKVGEKSPSVINPKSFEGLIKKMPKYSPALFALGLIASPVSALAITAIAATEVINKSKISAKKDNAKNSTEVDNIEYMLMARIKKMQTEKKLREKEIEKMEVEIEDINNELDQLNKLFASLVGKKNKYGELLFNRIGF